MMPGDLRAMPRLWALALVLSVLVSGAACGADSLKPPPPDEPSDLFWTLQLDKHAVMLSATAPSYDTLTVVATSRNYKNDVLSGLGAAQFSSTDPNVVLVSQQGTLVGLQPGTAKVIATLASRDQKYSDTLYVVVVDEPAPIPLGKLSIHPVPPDSAKTAVCNIGACIPFVVDRFIRLTDTAGLPYPYQARISDPVRVPIDMRVADTTMASLASNPFNLNFSVAGHKLGSVDLYARTTVFGVTRADTLSFRFGWPLITQLFVYRAVDGLHTFFADPTIKVGVGALIIFSKASDVTSATPTDIVFDDATNIESGHSLTWQPPPEAAGIVAALCFLVDCDQSGNVMVDAVKPNVFQAARTFNAPGVYSYHSSLNGTSGQILVVDESAELP